MKFIKRIFAWWDGQTIGTQLFTWRKGRLVGEDGQGNKYYTNKDGKKRWVIYNGFCDASRVPPMGRPKIPPWRPFRGRR